MKNQKEEGIDVLHFIKSWNSHINELSVLNHSLIAQDDRDKLYELQDQLHNLVHQAGQDLED